MPICKCGRNIPEGSRCFCDYSGKKNEEVVYTHIEKQEVFTQEDVTNFRNEEAKQGIEDFNYYRFLWKLLHTYQYESEENTKIWFESWKSKISCGNCKAHLEELLKILPVDYSSKEGFFKWTVEIHNMVNKKLEKPIISVEEALLIWENS